LAPILADMGNNTAAGLIPELASWNDGRGIDLESFAFAVGRYDHAIAYAHVLWPKFHIHDDCVFRREPDMESYRRWMESLGGERSRVEFSMNHLHVLDLFSSEEFEPTEAAVAYVSRLLVDMWSCKAARDFPERRIRVEATEGTADDLLRYEVTLFQERSL
jgi:hypothetical protein